jgi:hypothetical protein
MKKKGKLRKKESNFEKKNKRKFGENDKMQKKQKKKRKEECTVNYCCNTQCFVCGGTVIPLHHLDIS